MTVAIGCTGGKHRSVAMTEEIAKPALGRGHRHPPQPPRPGPGVTVTTGPGGGTLDLKVVALGGGHGLSASLAALRRVVSDLTAVVTVADNGGSSGRLRREFGVLPPGDLRQALAALCDDDDWGRTWARVLQHRFDSDGEMDNHAVGNLLIVSLWQLLGDAVGALDWVGRLLGAQGRVLPMSVTPLDIAADVRGLDPADRDALTTVRGQVQVASTDGQVHAVRLEPADPPACPEALVAGRRGRLGRARSGLVVHQRHPAPAGPRPAPGAGERRRPARW